MSIALFLDDNNIEFKTIVSYHFKIGKYTVECEVLPKGDCVVSFVAPATRIKDQCVVKHFETYDAFLIFIDTIER